jgi:hypothetical protein
VWRPKPTRADAKESADAHMVFVLPAEFYAPNREELPVAQLDLGPWPVIFEKPQGKNYKHLKALLYLKGYINGQPINKMLVDTGATVNILPYSVLHRLGRSTGDLIKTNVTLSDFNGQTSEAQGVLNVDLTVGSKTIPVTPAFLSYLNCNTNHSLKNLLNLFSCSSSQSPPPDFPPSLWHPRCQNFKTLGRNV